MTSRPAVVMVFNRSLPRAMAIAKAIDGEIHNTGTDFKSDIQQLFRDGRPIIGLVAVPILIRCLAPLLTDKFEDPPVVAVSHDGAFVLPLLGAHHGADRLANKIAQAIGATPTFRTATDTVFGLSLDEPPEGYTLGNYDDYKEFAMALLNGAPVRISGDAPWLGALPQAPDAKHEILVTEYHLDGNAEQLIFHPRTLAIGLGCERGTDPQELRDLFGQVKRQHNFAWDSVACTASIDLKEDEPAIFEFYDDLRLFSAEELNAVSDRIANPSRIVMKATGTASVAEAAALAAAGPEAELIVPKTKSIRATVAVARAKQPILDLWGRPRGGLAIVGIGPGSRFQRSPVATRLLLNVTDWVGYGAYLDLAKDLRHEQHQHRFELGEEERRARHAIALAKEGKSVALVCSGDAGIYSMAALVYELIDREPCRIGVEVIPGISAFQAAAASAGAMVGHDFCCISLSDLLTPWDIIKRRIEAAAGGDFVVAIYNPRSRERTQQLDRAIAILGAQRPPETPVVIAANLGRDGERVRIVPLKDFSSDGIDMLTIVLVGSSQSKSFVRGDGRTYAYTPRGYAAKRAAP